MPKPWRSGHLPINGLQLHYEMYRGPDPATTCPLLLIPGGFMSTGTMMPWVSAFIESRDVVVFDQQGHGRTPDIDRPLSYAAFADDAAKLVRALNIDRVDVMGYSQGGAVAQEMAVLHPGVVSKMVSLSAAYRRDGWNPSELAVIESLTPTVFAGSPVERAFLAHTPEPAAFDAFVEKMKVLGVADHDIGDDQLRSMDAPTMIVVGDSDAVRLEHAVQMFRLRGGGADNAAATGASTDVPTVRLVVLPATSHLGVAGRWAEVAPMVRDFLDDVAPQDPDLFLDTAGER